MSHRGNRGRGKNNRQTPKPNKTSDKNSSSTHTIQVAQSNTHALNHNNNNNNNHTNASPSNMPPSQPPHTHTHSHHHRRRLSGHGSAMPVPTTRRHRARRSGIHAQQIQQSLYESSFRRPTNGSIERLKHGAPFNAWHSFFSASSCDEIFHELTLALKSQPDLDITMHASGYKIRGRKFIRNIMCEFQIEMFDTTSSHPHYPNHILVEFQRRNGDGFVFEQFLHEMFTELAKTKLIVATKYMQSPPNLSPPTPLSEFEEEEDAADAAAEAEEKLNDNEEYKTSSTTHWHSSSMDEHTLRMLLSTLFDVAQNEVEMRRSAASFLASRIVRDGDDGRLVHDMVRFEPHIITKFSDLLLKCVDPQIVRCIGVILYHMLRQNTALKHEALKLNVKTVCEKVYKRWTEPVEKRYGSNNKYVIRVIPSLQVAQRMHACIEVLE
mmetsp:Transcript_23920/g.38420  ORF Transcript_23920/g.38420 Transcript_23920/m.38420 type:complete len:437 (+) Transcript_23920:81-1391(+)